MSRHLPGLNDAARMADVPNGIYLVRIQRVQYRWQRPKPFYAIQFIIVEPKDLGRKSISSRIYCTKNGVIKVSYTTVNGTSLLILDSFAPAAEWPDLFTAPAAEWPDLFTASGHGPSEVA